MTLKIVIDAASATAPFEQLRTQISERARSGALPVGYRLPTVRGLAEELGLAANTVAKAYRALEADGVVETRGRNGTFVAAAQGAGARELAAAAKSFAERARRLGADRDTAHAAARDAIRAVYGDD
ncbi:GntR family transcriptional regulator [Streptomyces clavuligerus]|uniref:GntR family transcriptional regulator n=1 Tax=Streptomyces clavuligerus TaxID=1901 RepID=UPI00018000F0|nr:GntR family transcriptional regulator [Streptomyces clavuligerus]ANW20927.1 GntR family transcriptional regulator [Streptomyces clavuligerus]AXU16707.1 GntR family transcriptional regulator [Streptomyces clavuligerus]EDY51864.1 GntR-family transcriptional regulator [Streptomyces clavuligerus]MBY6305655.1 GntR family transcriptional regulator [Streptomyces clavuligerus]QCS08326.1 GntR family transcriptional regulator [Streptomyces clavuligerus]